MFMMYLNVIARGWQLNKDTPFINELGKLKFFLIGLLMFSLSDLVITNDFFEFYIQPLKSLILFGILGVLVLNSITSTYVTINVKEYFYCR